MARKTDKKKVLLTLDITSMYTNIDNDFGKERIKFWLDSHPVNVPGNISKEFVMEALSIVLECNTFMFYGKYYLQIRRTSMRSKVSPKYVPLVMAYLELKLYEKIGQDYGHEIKEKFIKDWMRYLDDCFLHWDTSIGTVDNLLLKLQNLHPNIKFTKEESQEEISFLGINMDVHGKQIINDIYQKPTDSQQ